MALIRLDKLLAVGGAGTRSEVRKYIKAGRVKVNGESVLSPDIKIDEDSDTITFDGINISADKYVYIMMNKPSGVISATADKREKTVMDLLDGKYAKMKLFPAGRLDKDTTGLMILTNDGAFAHNSLSPKKHVEKRYIAHVTGEVNEAVAEKFRNGVELKDFTTKPAELIIKERTKYHTVTEIVISEGKFHQIKRMFEAVGCHVIYLKRTAFGNIKLDTSLKEGEYRVLDPDETEYARSISKGE